MRKTAVLVAICFVWLLLTGCGDEGEASSAGMPLEGDRSLVSVDWTGGVELPSSDGEMAVSEEVSGAPSAISQVETSLASAPMPSEAAPVPSVAVPQTSSEPIADALERLKTQYEQKCAEAKERYADALNDQIFRYEVWEGQVEQNEMDLGELTQQRKTELAKLEKAGHQNTQTYRMAVEWYDTQIADIEAALEVNRSERDAAWQSLSEMQSALDGELRRLEEWYNSEVDRLKGE